MNELLSKQHANKLDDVLNWNGEALAEGAGMKIEFIRKQKEFRKGNRVQQILKKRGDQPGLVHIFGANEIILIDAGTGNLRSVQKALESVGANVTRTDDPQIVLSGKKVVLPGVGAFGDFMAGLRTRALEEAVKEVAARGVPLLGICVGMQALFEAGEEMGTHAGLGLLAGKVTRFADSPSVKIPHTGWNQVEVQDEALLFNGIKSGAYVYFNHSYYCQARNPSEIIAVTDYGGTFACAVRRENLFGVQFHPEKSQAVGLQILKNFVEAT